MSNLVGLVIPQNDKLNLFISPENADLLYSYLNNEDFGKKFFERLEERKDEGLTSGKYWFVFFAGWHSYLKKKGHASDLLYLKSMPFFLLYLGIDFRKEWQLLSMPEYQFIGNDLLDYDIKQLGRR